MTDYKELVLQLKSLCEDVPYDITNLSNVASLIWNSLDKLNWAGFYFCKDSKLFLGPFQGKTACTEIECGKGVCGTALSEKKTLVVPNVHEFKGHIACDSASNSEIVIPIFFEGKVFGVLDIDSPVFDRFSDSDKIGLELLVNELEKYLHGNLFC